MNLLIVTPHFWPENFPINKWAEKISEKKHMVYILTGKPNYPDYTLYEKYNKNKYNFYTEKHKKICVIRLPIIPRKSSSAINIISNYFSFVLSFIIFLPKILKKIKNVDKILYYGVSPLTAAIPAIIIKKIKKCKLTFWIQDLWPDSLRFTGYIKNRLLISVLKFISNKIYNSADTILVQSKLFKLELKKRGIYKKINIFYNCVEKTNSKKKIKLNKKIKNILNNNFCITYGGNIGKAQYFDNLFIISKKIEKLKKLKILIFGSGAYQKKIKELIKKNNIKNIFLHTKLPVVKINEIFSKSKVLFLNLRKDKILSKTIPSKFQNYLSFEKPILVSADGEVNQIVKKNKCGLVSEAENDKKLYNNILKFYYMSDKKLKIMSVKSKKLFQSKFDINKNLTKFIEYINER